MKLKYLLFLIILLSSCKSEENNLFEFDPRNLSENVISLSEIADDITYIPLDNTHNLGLIYDNFEFLSNTLYLSEKDNGVLVFYKEGSSIRKIGSKGRGPGEYIFNYLFTVDNNTGTVYILDSGDIIKIYSKSGKFLGSYSLKEYGQQIDGIKVFDSKLFISYLIQNENNRYKWIFIDSAGNLIKNERRKTPAFSSRVGGSGGICRYDDRITYWNSFYTDTVFSIFSDLNEMPSFIIYAGEYRFPKSMDIIPPEELEKYFTLKQIIEVKHFWIIRYCINRKNEFVIIDKKSSKTYLTNWEFDGSGGIVNDFDGGTKFLPKSYFKENNREYLVGLIYPFWIKNLIAGDEFKNSTPKYPKKKKELEKLAASLKETDNPVLMLVRLKE